MTAIAKELDTKLKSWGAPTAQRVEKLIANIIALADREAVRAKLPRKPSTKNRDAFLEDKKTFGGRTPKDLARNHDSYLYGGK